MEQQKTGVYMIDYRLTFLIISLFGALISYMIYWVTKDSGWVALGVCFNITQIFPLLIKWMTGRC